MSINTLIVGGGGMSSIMYLGVLHYLTMEQSSNFHLKDNVHTLVGSSAGSLICFLLVIGFSPLEIYGIVESMSLPSEAFQVSVDNLIQFLETNGVTDCSLVTEALSIIASSKGVNRTITFSELFEKTKKRLVVTAVCLNTRQTDTFSVMSTPSMQVFDALRMSISIPFYFRPVVLNGFHYVDGALFQNAHTDYLQSNECVNDSSILPLVLDTTYVFDTDRAYVCRQSDSDSGENSVSESMNLWDYTRTIFVSMMSKYHNLSRQQFETTSVLQQKTIYIPIESHEQGIHFQMCASEKRQLFLRGWSRAKSSWSSELFERNQNQEKIET